MITTFTHLTSRLAKICRASTAAIIFIIASQLVSHAQSVPLRRPISPEKPMWLIHIDTWNYADPQKIIDLIPEDIRPYVVMNISISINHNETTGKWLQTEYAYETAKSWLRTCAENRMWAMIQQSSGGFQHFSDFDLRVYEEFYRDYPNLIGYNYAEQFWGYDDIWSVSWTQRMAHFTNLMKLNQKYGGYLTVSWCGPGWGANLNPVAMMKRNPEFAAVCKQSPENFILCEKFTSTYGFSDIESTALGTYLSGFSGQYGIRFDDTGWSGIDGERDGDPDDEFNPASGAAPILEHMMLTGQTVMDGPELIWTQSIRTMNNGQTADGYTMRQFEYFPQLSNISMDIFRKVLDGTVRILNRKEVIDRSKLVIINDVTSGSDQDKYSSPLNLFEGLYRMDGDGNLFDNKYWFKKSGRYPAIPTVFQLSDTDANSFQVKVNKSDYAARWPTIAAKTAEFNTLFPQEYTGDLYVGRSENGWITYNPYKENKTASATIPLKYNTCESVQLTYSHFSTGVIKEFSNKLTFYLTNFESPNASLKTDVIKIYGASSEPTYSFSDRASHQPSVITKSWENGILTLNVAHNGPLDITVNCAGTATGRLTSYKTVPVLTPEKPAVYTGTLQYEAENFDSKNIAGNVTSGVNAGIRNYSAQGYLRFGTNAAASIRKKITAILPGNYQLQTKYSASAGEVTSVDLYVNGVKVATPVFVKTANDSEWNINTQNVTLKAGENTIMFSSNRTGTYGINFDNITVSGSSVTRYDFSKDIAGTVAVDPPAAMITLLSGTAGVVSYTDGTNITSNVIKAYSGGATNGTGVASLDLFPGTADYSVTWKEYSGTTGSKKGILMRASNTVGTSSYAAGLKQGYLFATLVNSDGTVTLQPYISGPAGISLQKTHTSTFSLAANSPRWYRATAKGSLLKFECSKDSINWEGGEATSFTDNSYRGGTSQLVWGLGSDDFSGMLDNITFHSPNLAVSKLTLSGFEYQNQGPSASQAFSISGRSLLGAATVTAPAGFEISLNTVTGYNSSINLPLTADSIAVTNVYVRLKAGLAANRYQGDISVASGSTLQTVAVTGNVIVINSKLYNFSNDVATTSASTPPAADVSVAANNGATAGVASYTDASNKTSNYLRPYGGGLRNATGALDLNLFDDAADYSVVWKQIIGSAGNDYKVGMLLRGNAPPGGDNTGYVQGLKQGYLFIVYNNGSASPARSEFRIYKSTAATSLSMLTNVGVNTHAPAVGQPIWYRASATGSNPILKIEYSTDSITWVTGASTSDATAPFTNGSTQLVWGLAAANWDSYVDNITHLAVQMPTALLPQTITFNAIPTRSISSGDFSPGATASSGLTVSYTSSNSDVAVVVNGMIQIRGAGSTEITASQPGDGRYSAATPVVQTLVVSDRFMLPANNFTVKVSDEVCSTGNDGKISITATENMAYKANITINGTNTILPFRATLDIPSLNAGNYKVCITVDGQADYSQCFNLTVREPQPLSMYSMVKSADNTVVLNLSGSERYFIQINDQSYQATTSSVTLPLTEGLNQICVSTEKECQGTIEKSIFISNGYTVYPNPFDQNVFINMGNDNSSTAQITLTDLSGSRKYRAIQQVENGLVQVNLANLPQGMYIINVKTTLTESSSKILKQ